MAIKQCAVLGAGTMGSGIAGQLANAGIPVFLMDMPAKEGADRSAIARGAIEKMKKTDPAPLMSANAARLITPGNFEDDLGRLADCDWIVEVIIENPEIKQRLYKQIDAVRKPGSIVSSNTSTIPLSVLVEGQSDAFRKDFCITHFFNPPRYMRLLEIVRGPETRGDAIGTLQDLCDKQLGKGVVLCKDTPGFIANRVGTFWMACALAEAIERGLTVEEADAAHLPAGVPRTGLFALIDLIGVDLIPLVVGSLLRHLPKSDLLHSVAREQALLQKMVSEGLTGRKGKGGFFRVDRAAGGKKLALDLKTGEYRPTVAAKDPALDIGKRDLRGMIAHPSKVGAYMQSVLVQLFAYTAALVPEIADDIAAVDEAMRLGYGWKYGPFELMDQIGTEELAKAIEARGQAVPDLLQKARGRNFYRVEKGRIEYLDTTGAYVPLQRPDGVLLLSDIKLSGKPLVRNGSAAVWDIGDGVLCLEFTGKMNALDTDVLSIIGKAIGLVQSGRKGLVIYNEGANFSVGANIGLILFGINVAAWDTMGEMINAGHAAFKALKYAPFPVIAAPAGMALGGGCEIALHCDAIQAHAETYMGLVEVGVGIIPGWGGCKEMLARWQANPALPKGPMPAIAKVFEIISTAQTSKSAAQARELGFMRETDSVTMNRDRLLFDAKQRVLALAENYTPPLPPEFRLPGPNGAAALGLAVAQFEAQGKASEHDAAVATELARILTGGDTDMQDVLAEDDITTLEREAFLKLVRQPKTIARIDHMLATGKPLRN